MLSKFTQDDVNYIYSDDLEMEHLEEGDQVAEKLVDAPSPRKVSRTLWKWFVLTTDTGFARLPSVSS